MSNGHQETQRWARFSTCGRHRLLLTRVWDDHRPLVAFVGLNPSIADGTVDDPTIRRCTGFAASWGFGGMVMANLFTFRATDPRELEAWEDRVVHGADHALRDAGNEAELVVEAWGAHPLAARRADHVRQILDGRAPRAHLGLTKSGAPRHPLYVRAETQPILWSGGAARIPAPRPASVRPVHPAAPHGPGSFPRTFARQA